MRLPLLFCLVASTSLAQTRPVSSAAKQSADPSGSIIIRADRVVDGRGHVVPGGAVVVTGDKITRVGAVAGTPTYDLKGLTLIPGLIDAHSHLTWYFNRQGRYHSGRGDNDTPVESMLSTAGNAYSTLMAGFTTIQSPGSPEDKDLRDWIAMGQIPGPRVLTSLGPIQNANLTPDSLRAIVRRRKAEGADVIKIFASASIRDGGAQTLKDEQLEAICS
jgi:amidohydrolase family protein